MTSKQVMQQALEALESKWTCEQTSNIDKAIKALKAALSQQQQQQPVAYLAWRDGKPCYAGEDVVCADPVWPVDADDDRTSMPVYAGVAPTAQSDDKDLLTIAAMDAYQMGKRDALAQPVEPVAKYLGETPYGSHVQLYEDLKKGTELYAGAAPASQQGEQPATRLTDEQKEWVTDNPNTNDLVEFIEAFANRAALLAAAPEAQQCDTARVLEWMRTPNRKAAQFAFTEGPERQAAYWIEIAQSEQAAQPDARKVIEQLLYCVEAWERDCQRDHYWRDRDDAITAGLKWLEENK